MRFILFVLLLCTTWANAQKSGILEEAVGWASDFDYRYMNKGVLEFQEEKEVLRNIENWLTKLRPFVSSGKFDEKVPAVWASTHFYRQALFIYSYFDDAANAVWNKNAMTMAQNAFAFKNKYYRAASKLPVTKEVNLSFRDTAFIDAAMDAYATLIFLRTKDAKQASLHVAKLPATPVIWKDEEAPIAKAYLRYINSTSTTPSAVYKNLLAIIKSSSSVFEISKEEFASLMKNLSERAGILKSELLFQFYWTINERSDLIPEKSYLLYIAAANELIKQHKGAIKLQTLHEKLALEMFSLTLFADMGTEPVVNVFINNLVTAIQRNYPTKAPPKGKKESDAVTELLNGLHSLVWRRITEEQLATLQHAIDTHLEAPYSRRAAKAIEAINIK